MAYITHKCCVNKCEMLKNPEKCTKMKASYEVPEELVITAINIQNWYNKNLNEKEHIICMCFIIIYKLYLWHDCVT